MLAVFILNTMYSLLFYTFSRLFVTKLIIYVSNVIHPSTLTATGADCYLTRTSTKLRRTILTGIVKLASTSIDPSSVIVLIVSASSFSIACLRSFLST